MLLHLTMTFVLITFWTVTKYETETILAHSFLDFSVFSQGKAFGLKLLYLQWQFHEAATHSHQEASKEHE